MSSIGGPLPSDAPKAPILVLWEPQNPLNMGAVLRASRNFGVDDVRFVRPRRWDPQQMLVTAPNSDAFLASSVRRFETWEDAMEGVGRTIALSARPREERQPRWTVAEAVERIAADPAPCALVFGREDSGLPNHIVHRCDALVSIDTAPEYRSLNLAQSVVLLAHRAFEARAGQRAPVAAKRRFEAADAQAVERMMQQAERGMEAIGFFKGDQRANVVRTVRRVVTKASLDTQELATLWALFAECERVGRALTERDAPEAHDEA